MHKSFSRGGNMRIGRVGGGLYVGMTSPRGEVFDYEVTSPSVMHRLFRAKSFLTARKLLGGHAVLRSINPRRRRGRSRYRRNAPIRSADKAMLRTILRTHRRHRKHRRTPIGARGKRALRRILKAHRGRYNPGRRSGRKSRRSSGRRTHRSLTRRQKHALNVKRFRAQRAKRHSRRGRGRSRRRSYSRR
jgi:hypothetical protein